MRVGDGISNVRSGGNHKGSMTTRTKAIIVTAVWLVAFAWLAWALWDLWALNLEQHNPAS